MKSPYRRQQSEHRRGVFKEHREHRRVFAAAERIEPSARALVLAELTEGNDPDGSLEDERERQDRVVHQGVLDDMGLPHFVDALEDGEPRAEAEDQDGY